MTETVKLITAFIRIDLLIGFGLYSILFFISKLVVAKKEFINKFDLSACRIIIYAGVVYLILWLIGMFTFYFQIEDGIERTAYLQRLTGGYWFVNLLQPLFWVLLTQLLRIEFLRKSLIYRIVMSLLFVFSFERIDIIIISFNRGHLSSSWPMNLDFSNALIGLTTKTLIFILIASAYYFGKKRIKKNKFEKFSTKFNKNEDTKKVTDSDIEKLESEFKISLPQDYKFFIQNYGDSWTPDILDIIVDNELDLNGVQNFWDIESIIYDKKNEWTSQISTDLIPFASDCMGNIFCFLVDDLKESRESVAVYFFDHDFDTVEKESDSFSEWIDKFNRI